MSIFSDKFDQLKKADKAVKSPKYLQEVMGIGRIAENGIFEVGKGIYSRTYRFLDINYVTAGAEEQMRILKQVSPYQSISWFYTAPQGQISIFYKLKGYSKTFVADRISSDVALGYAYQSIMLNRLDTCLVCGTEAGVFPYGMSLFSSSDVLSKKRDACYCPYDLKRNGMVLGEGAGTLVIEELEHALKRNAPIYGEILSFSNNCDGVHHKEKNKNGKKYKEVIESCIRKANISYDEIDYINLDGAALWEDDVIETNVLKEIWGKEIGTVFLSCPKSMFGNTFGAAGALDAIINCLVIKNNTVPPTINYEDQDSNCDLNYTPNKALHRNINTVLQIARGRGGINSAMLLREFKE